MPLPIRHAAAVSPPFDAADVFLIDACFSATFISMPPLLAMLRRRYADIYVDFFITGCRCFAAMAMPRAMPCCCYFAAAAAIYADVAAAFARQRQRFAA